MGFRTLVITKRAVKYDVRKNCHITEIKNIFSRKAKRWIFL